MAKKSIKIRAKAKGDLLDIKCLISHPMETGQRKDKAGKVIPEHYIEELTVEVNGKQVVMVDVNGTVSKNPYFRFSAKGKKGDAVKISWKDNKGESDSGEAKAK
jgi:sulfur-oxidizing protein SoxZ